MTFKILIDIVPVGVLIFRLVYLILHPTTSGVLLDSEQTGFLIHCRKRRKCCLFHHFVVIPGNICREREKIAKTKSAVRQVFFFPTDLSLFRQIFLHINHKLMNEILCYISSDYFLQQMPL